MGDPALMIAAIALSTAVPPRPGDCRVVIVPKQATEEVQPADTDQAPCDARPSHKPAKALLTYDSRHRIVRAREALFAGQNLGRVYFPPRPEVRVGDRVSLTAHIGHVAIARDVIALQNAEHGQQFFVRDRDGQVFVMSTSNLDTQP